MSDFLIMKNETDSFNKSYLEAVQTESANQRASYVSAKNCQRFFHGTKQISTHKDVTEEVEMREISIESRTSFKDITDNNLDIVERSIREVTNAMHLQFARGFYQTISETCERTGNVVHAQNSPSSAEAFMTMIEKIEFVADKDEIVGLPQIRTGSKEQAERLMLAVYEQPPEYKARFEAIKKRKIAEAIERERARKAKFEKYVK